MKETINLKSIISGLVVIILGIVLILLDIFYLKTGKSIWISVGCSLLASGLVIFLTAIVVERNIISPLDNWGLEKIYKTRAEKSVDSDKNLEKAKNVDIIAFGLSTFRNSHSTKVEQAVKRGAIFRIITMNPKEDNSFIKQREKEEQSVEGEIKKAIGDLIDWADKINQNRGKKVKGKVIIKGYNSMTLDFYWRVDDELYIGPYWYNYKSQQTITYKYKKGKDGFEIYSDYFERLWGNDNFLKQLTK